LRKTARGKIVRYPPSGSFGFIKTFGLEEVERDVFFHETDLEDGPVEEGDTVEFDLEETEKGPRARNVKKAKSPWTPIRER